MFKRITYVIVAFLIVVGAASADEIITSFEEKDVPVLNEELRKLGEDITAGVDRMIDEDDMASDSDERVPTQQSTKAYVDAQITANSAKLGTWAGKSINTVYQAATDGFFVTRVISSAGYDTYAYIYTDGSNPPTTLRGQLDSQQADADAGSFTCPVKKDDYYKCTAALPAAAVTLYWIPLE